MPADSIRKLRFDDVRSMHLLVALSGGADSVALLALLCRERSTYGLHITAVHYHHGIRGDAADADAAFCRHLCAEMGVELIEGSGNVPHYARENHLGLESAAREMRYAFLHRVLDEIKADKIALAHHLDDQAETILMHLLRGAGCSGISGMHRIQGRLYRPLLEIPKADLVQFLQENGIGWREDSTNHIADNPRNALRLHVLPKIEESYPAAAAAIARYGCIAAEEDDCLRCMTQRFLAENLERGPYGQRLLLRGDEDAALLRRVLRQIAGGSLTFEKTDAAVAIARREKGRLEISGTLSIEKTPRALYFLPKGREKPAAVPLKIPGITALGGICRILAECGDFPIDGHNPLVECLDAEALDGAQLRLRQDGDRIHPLGAAGERLLSDYLIDKKMDRPLRNCMPVVARGRQILWAGGVGISHTARIQSDTRRRVRLTIIPITDERAEVHHEK